VRKLLFALIKPINPARIFGSFCDFFFQKEKVDSFRKAAGFSKAKQKR